MRTHCLSIGANLALLTLPLLGQGCASKPATGTEGQVVHYSYALPEVHSSEWKTTPLTARQWTIHTAYTTLPVFATGTSRDTVAASLASTGNNVVAATERIIVSEGTYVSGTVERLYDHTYAYGFRDGALIFGPNTYFEVRDRARASDFDPSDLANLQLLADLDVDSAGPSNELAWIYATAPSADVRDAAKAVYYARRAVAATGGRNPAYLDTLATALARSGDFGEAIRMQQRALSLIEEEDEGMQRRLDLYSSGKAYVHPVEKPRRIAADQLMAAAAAAFPDAQAGNPQAQYEKAMYILDELSMSDFVTHAKLARDLIHDAAMQGLTDAQIELGIAYQNGNYGFTPSPGLALFWFTRADQYGEAYAAYGMAVALNDPSPDSADSAASTRLLSKAASNERAVAAYELAHRYGEGFGVAQNDKEKQRILDVLMAQDYGPADYIGETHYLGYVVGHEHIERCVAARVGSAEHLPAVLMEMADELTDHLTGGARSVALLCDGYLWAWPTWSAPELIFNLDLAAARLGDRKAQQRVAEHYRQGFGVAANNAIAAGWWKRARVH